MLSVKTKKYQIPVQTYVKIGMVSITRTWWWAYLVPLALILIGIVWTASLWWMIGLSFLLVLLYNLFWAAQFYGISQLPQGKPFFERYYYEFDNQMLKIMKNEREGMPIKWDQVLKVEKTPEGLVFYLSKVQFIHVPSDIFRSETDYKFAEALLKRKNLLA